MGSSIDVDAIKDRKITNSHFTKTLFEEFPEEN